MNRTAVFVALLAAPFLSLLPRCAHADDAPKQAYVVLIGIDKYQDKQILPRKRAEADATALYDLFADKSHLNIQADHIKLLLGSMDPKRNSQPATRDNILKALKWVNKNAKKDDLVVVGFFGQGGPDGEQSCFFAVDSTYKKRADDAIDSSEIEQVFSKLKSRRSVILADINFSGFDPGKEKRPDPNLKSFYRAFLGSDEKEKEFSRALFLANSGLKASLGTDKHSYFAQVMLDALNGKADKFGYEADGLITVSELAKYVNDELAELIRKHGKNDTEKKNQMPIVLEGQSHDFVVDLNPPVYAKTQKRLKTLRKLADNKDLKKSVAEEGEFLLQRMPKLEAKQTMRKMYQRLVDGTSQVAEFRQERQRILDSLKLNNRELRMYALKVMDASRRVLDEYFKKVERSKLIVAAIKGMYKSVNEKMPSALEKQLKTADDASDTKLVRLLQDARKHLGRREDLGKGKDVTVSLNGMLGTLDRHTDYYDPVAVEELLKSTGGSFKGIGVQIRRNNTRDALEVVTPLIGSPAYKAGMYQGDLIRTIIREVDSKGKSLAKPEIISTKGMSTTDAVKKIVGQAGTKVKLIIERDGSKKPIEVELIRAKVELESVLGHKRNTDDSWNYVIDPENRICYVRLTEFSRNTKRDLTKVMKQLSKAGIKGFILDLRFNPGGLLDSAVRISDLFIDDGMIVTIKPRKGPSTSYIGKSEGSFLEFPMVCLVNGYSASGSEIVSACLQDHGRAIVMGSRSYGKGSVQTIHQFLTTEGLGMLKLTTATFWRPSGRNLNKSSTKGRKEDVWGVKPDVGFDVKYSQKELRKLQEFMRHREIIHRPDRPQKDNDIEKFRDRQLEEALNYLRGQIRTASGGKAVPPVTARK